MFASRMIDMPRHQLVAKLEQENCSIEGETTGHFIALVPGWDTSVTIFCEKWPFLRNFWDKVIVTPDGPVGLHGAQRHKVRLVYWTLTRLALHFIFSALALLEFLGRATTMSPAQMVLFFIFANALIPLATMIEVNSLFDRLQSAK